MPNNGDCWHCLFRDKQGKTMGELSSSDHLLQHLKEGYIHGSLIINALKSVGYRLPEVILDNRGSVIQAVRRYFYKSLGIPC